MGSLPQASHNKLGEFWQIPPDSAGVSESAFLGVLARTRLFSSAHTFSIGVRSENLWVEPKKNVCELGGFTNLTQLHQLCQEEWAKIHPTYCGKLVEGYPKRLTQVKQSKAMLPNAN